MFYDLFCELCARKGIAPTRAALDMGMSKACLLYTSETAFAVKKQDRYHLRWFTPAGEIDLCGHATLAAAGFEPVQQSAFHGGAGFPVFSDVLCTRRTDIYIDVYKRQGVIPF